MPPYLRCTVVYMPPYYRTLVGMPPYYRTMVGMPPILERGNSAQSAPPLPWVIPVSLLVGYSSPVVIPVSLLVINSPPVGLFPVSLLVFNSLSPWVYSRFTVG